MGTAHRCSGRSVAVGSVRWSGSAAYPAYAGCRTTAATCHYPGRGVEAVRASDAHDGGVRSAVGGQQRRHPVMKPKHTEALEQASVRQYCKTVRTPAIGMNFVSLAEQAVKEN